MKTKYIIYIICLFISSLYMSCKKEDNSFLSSIPYLFRPANFQVTTNKTVATITWAPVDSAVSYTIQISEDSLLFQNIIITDTLKTTTLVVELGGNTLYSARVKANARNSNKDSKYNETVTFRTPPENIFDGFSSFMTEQGASQISWLPGASATKLVFSSAGKSDVPFDISSTEVASGKKACTGLANGTYTVSIYNGQFVRGTVSLTLEGDVWVRPGDNLSTALASVTKDSSVVILTPGNYGIGSAVTNFTQNIKLRGLYKDTVSTVYMTSGASTTANMLNINNANQLNYIRFENIAFSGYVDNINGGTKIGYLFNQSTAINLNELSFKNCIIRDIGNTPVRLKDAPIKTIGSLLVDNCKIFDIGYSSVYAIVNNNVAGCVINNISFTNSTIYNFAGSLVLHSSGNSNSVVVKNCTFNEIATSGTGSSIRYLIDYYANTTTTYTVNNGVIIQNCIFGSTPRPYTDGVRVSSATNKQISGSYATADYKDNNATTTFSIVGSLTAYSGLSTDLFIAPTSGNFNFKDAAFVGRKVAGDPRWWSAQ